MKYIISIDGGGTKTMGVLFNELGEEVERVENGFSNFSVDVDISKSNILTTIEQLLRDINKTDIIAIQLGIAGYTNFDQKDLFLTSLQEKFECKVYMDTDAAIAYYSVKRDSELDVVMVLGGTGSVITYEQDNSIKFVGGFGHILGDRGSGYHLAIRALKRVIKQAESGKVLSSLSKGLLHELHTNDYNDIKKFVYNNQKKQIAELSKFIADKAMNDDKEAVKLFINEGVYLAEQAKNAMILIGSKNQILIGLKGGFLLEAPYVKETFIQELKKSGMNYQLDQKELEPVFGGYYLALKNLASEEVYL